jgi:5'(3')-deoxyribonucleotidase
MANPSRFVLGLDLDGTCADFYGRMREIAAEWTEMPLDTLPDEAVWGLTNWGIPDGWYDRFHRFAVTERNLFGTLKPLPGAPQALRRLSTEGVRIRIVTHRLVVRYFHRVAVAQTVEWLDHWHIPYWDLCFIQQKGEVGADLYVEDSPQNINDLRGAGKEVLIMTNSTNREAEGKRVDDWGRAEEQIRAIYYEWLGAHGLAPSPSPGVEPDWSKQAGDAPTF